MRTIQLYGSGSSSANSVASVTIPTSGKIKGVQVMLQVDSVTDNARVTLELNKAATSAIAANGALDPFLEVGTYGNFATSGLNTNGICTFYPMAVDVRQGEIVYLHSFVSGTAQYYANFIIHYE